MSEFQLKTPVAFIIFNRPDTTERVFAEITRAKPPKLLVVGDGPRASRSGESERVSAARAIINRVDWNCEVLTNYSGVNLGCKQRVSSGIDWVFKQVEEAIILEDDCVPHPTFFRFCEELLVKYRNDDRIGMISGDNFQFGQNRGDGSYYFTRYCHIWGWASWRRAWKNYDVTLSDWPRLRDQNWLDTLGLKRAEKKHWFRSFEMVSNNQIDTWDHQWTMACWSNKMLSIMPNVNLISNLGFGVEATHTHKASIYANMIHEPIRFPLIHPNSVMADAQADQYTAQAMYTTSLLRRLTNKICALLSGR
jgi:hypothetical protein